MKRAILLLVVMSALVISQAAFACVGKTLHIGIIDAPEDQLYAQMVSLLLSERTGTTVEITAFKNVADMYGAVRKGEVGVIIENPGRALKFLGRQDGNDGKSAFESAKKELRSAMNLVYLEPFGGEGFSGPVVSMETINRLPALPKLVNKLGGKINDATCARLLRSVKQGEKPEKVARNFLKTQKLI